MKKVWEISKRKTFKIVKRRI